MSNCELTLLLYDGNTTIIYSQILFEICVHRNECINCKVKFGEYHCDICNLWMSADDKPYHCHECGFCRVGGRDKFRHCKGCGMCIDVNLFEEHNCKAGKYMANCPVCYEDLFSSRMTTHVSVTLSLFKKSNVCIPIQLDLFL
jgi:hypothetical protein